MTIQIQEAIDRLFRIELSSQTLRERLELTPKEKLKFYFSKEFREEIQSIIFEYDTWYEEYQVHQRFFQELEMSVEILHGGVVLERTLKEVLTTQKDGKRRTVKAYVRLSNSLQMLSAFYNEWNVERHEAYKRQNCKRLLVDVIDRLKTCQYVLLLKTDAPSSMASVESQLRTVKADKAMVVNSKVLECDYYIGLQIDGVVIQKTCSVRDIYNILWDGFSYLPVPKLAIKDY